MLVCYDILSIINTICHKFSPLESASTQAAASKKSGRMDVNMSMQYRVAARHHFPA